jgi:hypothetical protein
MGELGCQGRVIAAGEGGAGVAVIGGRSIAVVSLRGGPLACGDLVRVVAAGPQQVVVEVRSGGAALPLFAPRPLRAAPA